ncbi:hypothetical protein GALMADRAFT_133507 [Galerina marginata CBS 339.88]|uniref:MYND-type domain-containing protein n=1 Tax=Galerina marginata (strain CBS 339.88) TaxID=685588 RepID=A0A067TW32_GALM3|nr:hypothetical protein GALMADRAFT_133507 [Galerina marginata CBS 339.88]
MPPKKSTKKDSRSSTPSDSAQFFLNSIEDPNNPKHCGRCLLGALSEPSSETRQAARAGAPLKKSSMLIHKNAKFWNTVARFLFTERTDEGIEMLLTRLSKCSCQMRDPLIRDFHDEGYCLERDSMNRTRMHEQSSESQRNAYSARRCGLIVGLFAFFGGNIRSSKAKSVVSGSALTWPSQPQDVLPFGADSLVRSLLQWYRFVPDPIILMIAGPILPLCESLLIPSLIKYDFTSHVVGATHRLAIKVLADYQSTNILTMANTIETCQLQASSLNHYYLMVCRGLPSDVKAALVRGSETKLVQACSLLSYITEPGQMPEMSSYPTLWADTAFVAHDIFHLFQMQKYPLFPVHPVIVAFDLTVIPQRHGIRPLREGSIFDIRNLRSRTQCFRQGCPNTHASVGKEFQRCGGCKITSYCGRECQMKSWRADKFPHRRGCAILQNVVELGGGLGLFNNDFNSQFHFPTHIEESTATILRNWSQVNLEDSALQYVKDWCKDLDQTTYPLPDGNDKSPGYADYVGVLAQFIDTFKGPKPFFFDKDWSKFNPLMSQNH